MKRPKTLDELRSLILSRQPGLYLSSQTSTVLPHGRLAKVLGETALVDLSCLPQAISLEREELGQIGLQFDELVVEAGSAWVDKTLSNIEIRSNHGFLIVGIRQAGGSTVLNPPASTRLAPADVVIVLGHSDDTAQLAARLSAGKGKLTYRGATVDA